MHLKSTTLVDCLWPDQGSQFAAAGLRNAMLALQQAEIVAHRPAAAASGEPEAGTAQDSGAGPIPGAKLELVDLGKGGPRRRRRTRAISVRGDAEPVRCSGRYTIHEQESAPPKDSLRFSRRATMLCQQGMRGPLDGHVTAT